MFLVHHFQITMLITIHDCHLVRGFEVKWGVLAMGVFTRQLSISRGVANYSKQHISKKHGGRDAGCFSLQIWTFVQSHMLKKERRKD